jgi:hypothetical protein
VAHHQGIIQTQNLSAMHYTEVLSAPPYRLHPREDRAKHQVGQRDLDLAILRMPPRRAPYPISTPLRVWT